MNILQILEPLLSVLKEEQESTKQVKYWGTRTIHFKSFFCFLVVALKTKCGVALMGNLRDETKSKTKNKKIKHQKASGTVSFVPLS